MILRMLLRYLANNEQVIQRMAESYPMRRAAQLVVSIMYRAKGVAYENRLHEMSPQRFRNFMQTFKRNVKEEIEGIRNEIKKNKN